MITQLFFFAAAMTSSSAVCPPLITIQLASALMAASWVSFLLPSTTRSSAAILDARSLGSSVPMITLPFMKYPCSLPSASLPFSVSAILLYWVLALASIVSSAFPIKYFAISPIAIMPSSLPSLSVIGRDAALASFISSQASLIVRLESAKGVL